MKYSGSPLTKTPPLVDQVTIELLVNLLESYARFSNKTVQQFYFTSSVAVK